MDDLYTILAKRPPAVQALARRVRESLLRSSADLTERPQPGWGSIGYHHRRAGYICGVFPLQDEVKLYFEWGCLLNDPDKLLRGSGKRCRHLRLSPDEDLPEAAIHALLLEAIALRSPHAAR